MAIAGHIALNFRKLRCLDDTNEAGKDEIIFYPVLIIRDPVNRKIISGISKSQLFKNMDKGVVRNQNLSVISGTQVGHDCLMLERGNLLDVSFNYEAPDQSQTTFAFAHANNNYAFFVLMTEHDDSSTTKILNEIRSRVSQVITNTPSVFTDTPDQFRLSVSTAINQAFASAKKTSLFKNDDDKIRLADCLPEDLILNGFPGNKFTLNLSVPCNGDGGVYQLDMDLTLVVRFFDSTQEAPLCL